MNMDNRTKHDKKFMLQNWEVVSHEKTIHPYIDLVRRTIIWMRRPSAGKGNSHAAGT